MSKLSNASIVTKFNDASSGLFKAGQTGGISSEKERTLIEDLTGSFANLTDHFGVNTNFPEELTSGAAIAWDLGNKIVGDAKLTTSLTATVLTLSNFLLGTTRSLWIDKKTNSELLITLAGYFFRPASTVSLAGPAGVYRLVFQYTGAGGYPRGVFVDVYSMDNDTVHKTIYKDAHGLSVGDVVRHNGSAYSKLSALTQVPLGIVDYLPGIYTESFLNGWATGLLSTPSTGAITRQSDTQIRVAMTGASTMYIAMPIEVNNDDVITLPLDFTEISGDLLMTVTVLLLNAALDNVFVDDDYPVGSTGSNTFSITAPSSGSEDIAYLVLMFERQSGSGTFDVDMDSLYYPLLVTPANQFRIVTEGFVRGLNLSAGSMYYVQSNGTLGTTVTNLPFLYAVSSATGYIIRQSLYAKKQDTVSTAGGTITLDMGGMQERIFKESDEIAENKVIAFDNATNALRAGFFFSMDQARVLTFPSDVKMADLRWDDSAKTWTPDAGGEYEAVLTHDLSPSGTWRVRIFGPDV